MAFQGNAFQPNAFQAGTSDAAEEAATLVGAVQVLEVYQYRPPTSFVGVAQIVSLPVEALLPPAWKQVGTQTSLAPSSKARVFFDNQERLRDFLGAVQVVDNYGQKPPLTVVTPGWSRPEPTPPAVETFLAWAARATSTQPLAANVNVAQPKQAIEDFFPQAWAGRTRSVQPPASRSALFHLVEPPVERFDPRHWPPVVAASFLAPASRTAIFHRVEPIEAFDAQAWRVSLRTAVEPRGSAVVFLPVEPTVEAFYPQGQRVSVRTAIDARSLAATFQLVFEPAVVVEAPPTLGWGTKVQTSLDARSRAATFQIVELAAEAFYPQAWRTAAGTAVRLASAAATFQIVSVPIEAFYPQAWRVRTATAVEARGRVAVHQVVKPPVVEDFFPVARLVSVGSAIKGQTWTAVYQLVVEPAPEVVLVFRGIVQVLETYQTLRPTSFVRAALVRDEPPFVAPPFVEEVPVFDSGFRRHDHEPERQKQHRQKQEKLRETVERAFRQAFGEPEETAAPEPQPVKRRELRRVAVAVLPQLRLEGLSAPLAEIMRLLDRYQEELLLARALARRKDDEEALLVLMMVA